MFEYPKMLYKEVSSDVASPNIIVFENVRYETIVCKDKVDEKSFNRNGYFEFSKQKKVKPSEVEEKVREEIKETTLEA